MDERMQEEMHRCAREGTPRPESSAVRAHAPNAFWAFADSWQAIFHSGVLRPLDQGALPRLHLPHREVRVLRQPALDQGDHRRPAGAAVRRAAQLRDLRPVRRPPEGRARLRPGDRLARSDVDDAFWDRLHGHFSEPELVELGCFIALTFGQQSWIRLLGIDHHEYLAGTDASMAPGFRTAEELARDQGRGRTTGPSADVTGIRVAEDREVLVELAGPAGRHVPAGADDGRPLHAVRAAAAGRDRAAPVRASSPTATAAAGWPGCGTGSPATGTSWTSCSTPGTPAPGAATAPRSSSATTPAARCVRDRRQGMDLFNRAPLEFEDEVAILGDVAAAPGHRRRPHRPRRRQPRRRDALQARLGVPGRGHAPGSRASRPTTSSSTSTPTRRP